MIGKEAISRPDGPALKFPGPEPVTEAREQPVRFSFYAYLRELIERRILVDLPGGATKVLLVLGAHANQQARAFPSRQRLMRLTGLAASSLTEAVEKLLTQRLIRRQIRRGRSTVYTLINNLDPGLFADLETHGDQGKPRCRSAGRGGAGTPAPRCRSAGAPMPVQRHHNCMKNESKNDQGGVAGAGPGAPAPPPPRPARLTPAELAAQREEIAFGLSLRGLSREERRARIEARARQQEGT